MKSSRVINHIFNQIKDSTWCTLIATTQAETMQMELQSLFESNVELQQEDILNTAFGQEVWEIAEDEVQMELNKLREDRHWEKYVRQVANRATYLPSINMEAHARKSGLGAGTIQWRFSHDLDSNGLMVCMLEHAGLDMCEPVVMNVENHLPMVKIDGKNEQLQVPQSEIEEFWNQGYLYSAGRTVWNVGDSPIGRAVRDMFQESFPYDISFSSYNRRFRAPLVPGGYLPELSVRTQALMVGNKYQGADGSGVYDPEHPEMRDLVGRYGMVAFQITARSMDNGKVWKGILLPRPGINYGREPEDQHSIVFDHLMVKSDLHKSLHKSLAKNARADGRTREVVDTKVHVGIMKAKVNMGRVTSCFELIEQLSDREEDREVISTILTELVDEAMERINKLGPEGLLGRATRDDPKLARLAQFLVAANKQLPTGSKINPLDIPMLRAKIEDSLGKALWPVANGGGIKGYYPMTVIDNTLQPGTVVISKYGVGTKLAAWRFPTILAQGLLVLKVVEPDDHHMVDGNIIPNCIFMNAQDITVGQQGDDDGDEIGVSNDPRLIKLFSLRKDNNIYHIEPNSEKRWMLDEQGNKVPVPTFSTKGREYIAGDPMGPVGALTIMKAKMAAIGAKGMELACAVGCQEAIDSQKNFVLPTDPYKAADIKNWYKDENGEYHIHRAGHTDNWLEGQEPGEFPLSIWEDACDKTLIAYGCVKTFVDRTTGAVEVKPGWPLGWRTQIKLVGEAKIKLRKAVAFNNLQVCQEKQDSEHRNWVHFCHDRMVACWREMEEKWQVKDVLPAKNVLGKILGAAGISLAPTKLTWTEYQENLRERSGLNWYGREFKKLMAKKSQDNSEETEQTRLRHIDILREALDVRLAQLGVQDLLDIWTQELGDTWWYLQGRTRVYCSASELPKNMQAYKAGTPNYAFTAVSNSNSSVLDALGVELQDRCRYLTDRTPDLADRCVNWCFQKGDNPYQRLSLLARNDKGHAACKTDGNGQPIQFGECPDCMNVVTALLVKRVRDEKKVRELEGAMRLNSALNAAKQQQVDLWDIYETQMAQKMSQQQDQQDYRDEFDCQENYL